MMNLVMQPGVPTSFGGRLPPLNDWHLEDVKVDPYIIAPFLDDDGKKIFDRTDDKHLAAKSVKQIWVCAAMDTKKMTKFGKFLPSNGEPWSDGYLWWFSGMGSHIGGSDTIYVFSDGLDGGLFVGYKYMDQMPKMLGKLAPGPLYDHIEQKFAEFFEKT